MCGSIETAHCFLYTCFFVGMVISWQALRMFPKRLYADREGYWSIRGVKKYQHRSLNWMTGRSPQRAGRGAERNENVDLGNLPSQVPEPLLNFSASSVVNTSRRTHTRTACMHRATHRVYHLPPMFSRGFVKVPFKRSPLRLVGEVQNVP